MASERGADNIRKYNAARERQTLLLVEHELQLCRKRKIQFRSVGVLAGYLSDRTRVHRTTLVRNPKYRMMLALHVSSQAGAASLVGDGTDNLHVLRVKLASAQVEVGNLRQQVKRLAAQQARLTTIPAGAHPAPDAVEFANLCVLLCLVLTRAEVFAVDTETRSVLDLAARPSDRVIGGPERARAFVSWMERNAELPFVKDVRRTKQ